MWFFLLGVGANLQYCETIEAGYSLPGVLLRINRENLLPPQRATPLVTAHHKRIRCRRKILARRGWRAERFAVAIGLSIDSENSRAPSIFRSKSKAITPYG